MKKWFNSIAGTITEASDYETLREFLTDLARIIFLPDFIFVRIYGNND